MARHVVEVSGFHDSLALTTYVQKGSLWIADDVVVATPGDESELGALIQQALARSRTLRWWERRKSRGGDITAKALGMDVEETMTQGSSVHISDVDGAIVARAMIPHQSGRIQLANSAIRLSRPTAQELGAAVQKLLAESAANSAIELRPRPNDKGVSRI